MLRYIRMMQQILDFHTHILPGMDDGSRSIEESLSILREECRQGVKTAVLTPHFYAFQNSPGQFLKRREEAWNRLKPHLEDMPSLLLGAEVHYFEGICRTEDLGTLCVEGTDLLLLEMPMCRWTTRMVDDVIELNERGDLKIVLAHVERYLAMQPFKTFERLLSFGILFQSNVSFFADWKTRHKAMSMLKRDQIHLLGSDCHSMGSRRPNWEKLPAKAAHLHEQALSLLMERNLDKMRV